jgi:hypothetical protein
VVSAWHLGAYDRLTDAYAGLQAWMKGVGIQRGDQFAELAAQPNHLLVHAFDSTDRV